MRDYNRHYYFSAGESMGDTLVATPIVKSLKEIEPDCTITWYVMSRCRGLLDFIPEIDEVIVTPDISSSIPAGKEPIVLHGLYVTQYGVGNSVASIGHLVDCCYLIAEKALGKELPRYRQPYLEVIDELAVPSWLRNIHNRNQPYITVQSQVGSGPGGHRNTSIKILIDSLRKFNMRYQIPIVQIGSDQHPYIGDADWGVYDLRGSTLAEGAWAIKHSSLFLGPTSGPCLEADAFGVPVVLISSPSDPPQNFGPIVSKTWVMPPGSDITVDILLSGLSKAVEELGIL